MAKGMDLPPCHELLAEPASRGVRRVAIALLETAVVARQRLEDPNDTEALHDFRVGLRRTRSWISALGDELGDSVRGKHRRRLRAISRAAGAARDAQVHATWLQDVEGMLRPRERPGVEWLRQRVAEQQRQAGADCRAVVADALDATAAKVLEELAVFTVRVDLRRPLPERTVAQALAPRIIDQANALGDRLAAVQSMQDQAVAHAARIAGKRLRYLIEPIADAVDGGAAVVKRLRILQDIIGEMHDVHVMAEEVVQAAEHAAAEQARRVARALLDGGAADETVRLERTRDPRPGLLAIAGQLRSRGHTAFGELQQHWLADHAQELPRAARAIAEQLTSLGDAASVSEPTAARTTAGAATAPPPDRLVSPALLVVAIDDAAPRPEVADHRIASTPVPAPSDPSTDPTVST